MKRVLTAALLIPVVLLLVLWAPLPVMAAFVALVAVLAIREFLDIIQPYGIEPLRLPVYALTLLLFLATGFLTPARISGFGAVMFVPQFLIVAAPFLLLAISMKRQSLAAFPAAASSSFAVFYIALPLVLLVQLRALPSGTFLLVYLLALVWAGDTAAYYVGRNFGRHKLAPRISPGKTWEGTVASLLASAGLGVWMLACSGSFANLLAGMGTTGTGIGYFPVSPLPVWHAALLSILVNVAAQIGDLAESLVKRGAGVKDSGSILPGHGGMLDRIDALLFAAPIVWYHAVLQLIFVGP